MQVETRPASQIAVAGLLSNGTQFFFLLSCNPKSFLQIIIFYFFSLKTKAPIARNAWHVRDRRLSSTGCQSDKLFHQVQLMQWNKYVLLSETSLPWRCIRYRIQTLQLCLPNRLWIPLNRSGSPDPLRTNEQQILEHKASSKPQGSRSVPVSLWLLETPQPSPSLTGVSAAYICLVRWCKAANIPWGRKI